MRSSDVLAWITVFLPVLVVVVDDVAAFSRPDDKALLLTSWCVMLAVMFVAAVLVVALDVTVLLTIVVGTKSACSCCAGCGCC